MTDYQSIITSGLESKVNKPQRVRISDFVVRVYKSCSRCGERYTRGYQPDDRFCSRECSYNYDN